MAKLTDDDELHVIIKVMAALKPLSVVGRARVLEYVSSRFESQDLYSSRAIQANGGDVEPEDDLLAAPARAPQREGKPQPDESALR